MNAPERPPAHWRVVLDTNVLISAYRFGGKPRVILELALSGAIVALTSEPLKDELAGVLAAKFLMPSELIQELCASFWEAAERIDPKIRLGLCADEDDNRVLECAIEGHARFIVTGDRDLLRLPPFTNFLILTPREFLDRLQGLARSRLGL